MTEDLIHEGKVIEYNNLKTFFESRPSLFNYVVSEMTTFYTNDNKTKKKELVGFEVDGVVYRDDCFGDSYYKFFLSMNKFLSFEFLKEVVGRTVVKTEDDFNSSGRKALMESMEPNSNKKFNDYRKLNDCYLYTKMSNMARLEKVMSVCKKLKKEVKPIYV